MLKNEEREITVGANSRRFTDYSTVGVTAVNILLPILGIVVAGTFETRITEAMDYTEALISRLTAQGFASVLLGSIVLNAIVFLVMRLVKRLPVPRLVFFAEAGLTIAIAAWLLGESLSFAGHDLLSSLVVWGGGAFAASTSILALVLGCLPYLWTTGSSR